jgi:hypothetical protein
MNSDGTFLCFPTGAPDSSSSWSLPASGVLRFPTLSDSLQNRRPLAGVRAFRTRSASQVFIVAPAHTLSPDTPIDLPIGLDVPQAAGGRFIVSSYPFVSGTISTPGFPQRASIVLLKVLQHLGLGP